MVDELHAYWRRGAAIWPPSAVVVPVLAGLRDALDDERPAGLCCDYLAHNESGSGTLVVAPTRDEPLVVSGVRLLRYLARCGRQLPEEVIFSEGLPEFVEAALGDGGVALGGAAAQERVDFIRRVLTEGRSPTIILDGTRELTRDAAARFRWPLREPARLGLALRDDWNDRLVLVRTATQDALLLQWATGA
ncbi:MAG: hypothetical protein H6710_08890 [Myxococcales bacterium]|nr:hypothetical protein [Myxococcales bacterium]